MEQLKKLLPIVSVEQLFNVVSNTKGIPHAILIRAIKPKKGIKIMLSRRNFNEISYNLTNGPGKLSQALGINKSFNSRPIQNSRIWVEDSNNIINKKDILSGTRIGVDYAGADAKLPYRFYIKSKWVSQK